MDFSITAAANRQIVQSVQNHTTSAAYGNHINTTETSAPVHEVNKATDSFTQSGRENHAQVFKMQISNSSDVFRWTNGVKTHTVSYEYTEYSTMSQAKTTSLQPWLTSRTLRDESSKDLKEHFGAFTMQYTSESISVSIGGLHQMGILENVSRPLAAEDLPKEIQGKTEIFLSFGKAPRTPHTMRRAEGYIYNRFDLNGKQAFQSHNFFTMKLYSQTTSYSLNVMNGALSIPVEEDGSLLAGMPDGTTRRVTINEDALNQFLKSGYAHIDMIHHAATISTTSTESSNAPSTTSTAQPDPMGTLSFINRVGTQTLTQRNISVKSYSLNLESSIYKIDNISVNSVKANMERHKANLIDTVKNMIRQQASVNRHAKDHATKESGEYNYMTQNDYWGVEQTSDRIVQYAMALTEGDADKLDMIVEAFEKGYQEAEKQGALSGISQRTRQRVHEKFEDLRKQYALEAADISKEGVI